jgi:hypothetical protein
MRTANSFCKASINLFIKNVHFPRSFIKVDRRSNAPLEKSPKGDSMIILGKSKNIWQSKIDLVRYKVN